jgi:nucleotide-binding universal stress UspA family protein
VGLEDTSGMYLEQIIAAYMAEAEAYLKRVSDVLGQAGLAISSVVREGEAASLLVGEAETVPGTLIAMSTHGRSGISRWVMGSVTDKVLHAAACPMLIIRSSRVEEPAAEQDDERGKRWTGPVFIRNITVPLDGSDLAEKILPHAISAAKGFDVPVAPVRVVTDPAQHAEATEYLERASANLREQGVTCPGGTLLRGEPAEALLSMLQAQPETLVTMTTRGHSGIQRWVLGSVTDRIARYSGTPVLVVQGE